MKESIEKPNILSAEQQEKVAELARLMEKFKASLVEQNDADEATEKIRLFAERLMERDFNPNSYYLWLFLNGGIQSASADIILDFDTPDGDIENFIRELTEQSV